MNKKIILVSLLVILGIAIYGYLKSVPAAENPTADAPKIEITPQSFDFGEIKYGEIAEYTFKVKNSGKEVLEIKRVATSCGCTTAKVSPDKIEPGQTADLLVSYDTGAMSGSHGRGKQERIIYVKSSDPANPQVQAMIYATVQ